jgi:formylglycine-generating enzyme required for sulfatase activity
MPDLRANGASRFADADEAEAKLRECGSPEIPLIDAFREARQRRRRGLVILGDPGSGKTTHLKRLLLYCLKENPAGLGLPAGTVPVFLPLRDLDDLTLGIDAFIEKTLDSPHLDMSKGFGQRLLQGQPLLLLFDGLDEVSDPQRRAQVSRWIEQAAQARPHCTAVVTCRFAGYDDQDRLGAQFLELHLRPLSPVQADGFIRNWYRAVETGLAGDTTPAGIKAAEGAASLIERLRQPDFRSARMATLIRNPLLLANLCLVHRDRGALPHNRHQLYDECIDVLLEHWREVKSLPVSVPAELGRRALQPAALWLHQEQGRIRATAAQPASLIEPVLRQRHWPGGDAEALLRAVRDESGLLTGWGQDQFGFMHLGFQEYLAACELRRLAFEGNKQAVLGELATHHADSWWQEVILLLLAQGNPSLFAPFMAELLKRADFDPAGPLAGLIGEEAAEPSAEPLLAWLRQPIADGAESARRRALLPWLQRLLSAEEFAPLAQQWGVVRAGMGVARGQARASATAELVPASAPPFRITAYGGVELLLIPGGSFRMGSPPGVGFKDERPQHEVAVQPFYLGKYPVTNEEYARYLQANPDVEEPKYWGDRRFNQARQPVVGVDWEDACRFAAWAGGRLPSEAEWEYACRADTQTAYWWGENIGVNRANCRNSGSPWSGKQPSPVGSFGANPFGLYDTHGNVWEWLQDLWHENYQGAPTDGSAWEASENVSRVLRGGSWDDLSRFLCSVFRDRNIPVTRRNFVGFRLAQDL